MNEYKNTNWWKYMEDPMRDLVEQSYALLEQESGRAGEDKTEHKDHSFIVFPMAKAYEGFLKKLFFDMKLIGKAQYTGEHFRIGRALNPNLPKRYRSGWVFGKLVLACKGEMLPLQLWETWKRARNRIFHYFPDHQEFVTLVEARELLGRVNRSMEEALAGCRT